MLPRASSRNTIVKIWHLGQESQARYYRDEQVITDDLISKWFPVRKFEYAILDGDEIPESVEAIPLYDAGDLWRVVERYAEEAKIPRSVRCDECGADYEPATIDEVFCAPCQILVAIANEEDRRERERREREHDLEFRNFALRDEADDDVLAIDFACDNREEA